MAWLICIVIHWPFELAEQMISYTNCIFPKDSAFLPSSPGISILIASDIFLTPAFLSTLACYRSSNLDLSVCVKNGTGIWAFTSQKRIGRNRYSQNCSIFPLAFVAGWLQGHWRGFISRNYVVWPTFFLMNLFIALKGSNFWFYIWLHCSWCCVVWRP